ncbi:MAG TPA: DUF473 domain-containing protein [Methanoregulaceae archaeon]|nr:DUF473 domain-containing protein [Methanoregulaceae archaeon]
MQCAALTGISPDVIKELKQGKSRTLELQSTHNVVTLGGIEPGTLIFLTSVNVEDLGVGDPGIIVETLSVAISMKRTVEYSQGYIFEERERMSARVKVKYCSNTTVKSSIHEGMFDPVLVEVVKACPYHAI